MNANHLGRIKASVLGEELDFRKLRNQTSRQRECTMFYVEGKVPEFLSDLALLSLAM